MSHQETIAALRQVVKRMQWLNFIQLIPDTLVIYGILQLAFSQPMVPLFNVTFTRQKAGLVVILFALIDLCVTGIRYNYRQDGRFLITQIRGKLSAADADLIRKFERFK